MGNCFRIKMKSARPISSYSKGDQRGALRHERALGRVPPSYRGYKGASERIMGKSKREAGALGKIGRKSLVRPGLPVTSGPPRPGLGASPREQGTQGALRLKRWGERGAELGRGPGFLRAALCSCRNRRFGLRHAPGVGELPVLRVACLPCGSAGLRVFCRKIAAVVFAFSTA